MDFSDCTFHGMTMAYFFYLGDRRVGRGSGAIKLDAETLTVDPDKTSQILSCTWRCEDANGGLCYSVANKGQLIFASISGCQTEVQSSYFTAGKTYTIRLVSTKLIKYNYPVRWHLKNMLSLAFDWELIYRSKIFHF